MIIESCDKCGYENIVEDGMNRTLTSALPACGKCINSPNDIEKLINFYNKMIQQNHFNLIIKSSYEILENSIYFNKNIIEFTKLFCNSDEELIIFIDFLKLRAFFVKGVTHKTRISTLFYTLLKFISLPENEGMLIGKEIATFEILNHNFYKLNLN